MRTVARLTLAAVLGAAFAATALAQTPDRVTALAPAFAVVDRIFTDYAREGHVPGMAWGVIVDGELAHTGAFGVRDTVTQAPVDARHGLPHRLDDQELHRDGDPEAARRGQAVARRSRREVRARADGPHLSHQRLAAAHDPAPALARRRVSRRTTRGATSSSPTRRCELSQMLRGGIPFSNAPGIAYEYSNYGFAILGRIVAQRVRHAVRRLRAPQHPEAARHDGDDARADGGAGRPARARLSLGGRALEGGAAAA